MDHLFKDIRYAIRSLAKHPGFTSVAVITLALGIGANTAIFSVVNSVLLRPLPFSDPERIIWVWDTQPQLPTAPASVADFLDWKEQNRSFEYMAAVQSGNMLLDTGSGTEDVPVGLVTPETFSLFRVRPILGRTFTNEETLPGPPSRVAVLSYSTWQSEFGSDPNVIGRTLQLSGAPHTIIGVMQAGFSFPERPKLWRPLAIDPKEIERGPHYLRVLGRLKRDVTLAQAQADMSAIAGRLAQQYPDQIAGHGVKLERLANVVVGDIGLALYVLLAAVGFVLLIACANLANLLLARVGARQKEFAVRTALGASRLRIIRQLLTESIILAVTGGALGLLLAFWAVSWVVSLSPDTIPRVHEISVDPRVAGFTLLVSIVTGVLFGLAPALQVSRPDLSGALKESGRTTGGAGGSRLRGGLVMSEVALSLVLLIGAGLMIRSFVKLNQVDPGFSPDRVMTVGVALLPSKYPEEQVAITYSQILERAANVPGVLSVGATGQLPFSGSNTSDYFTIEGRPAIAKEAEPLTEYGIVTPRYFESMGIPLLAGRDVAATDTKQSPNVVVINDAFARRHFTSENPLGHRIKLQNQERDPLLIIGVVGNVRNLGLDEDPLPEAYVPFLQDPLSKTHERSMTIVARTKSEPEAIAGSLRAALTSLDKNLPMYALKPMTEYIHDSVSRRRFNMVLLSAFSGIALVLAAIGIYGVISYGVAQRTREMGIRMALGAQSRDVLKLVVRQAMILTLGGVVIGLLASFALTRLMKNLLFSVSVTDPLTFAVIALLLILIALFACLIPARRATKVDPLVALREE